MVDPATATAMVRQIRAQHLQLHWMVDTVKHQASRLAYSEQVADAALRLREVIPRLRVFLQRHFQQETEGGWLEEAACQIPRLSHCLNELERQHQVLLQ